MSQLQQFNDSLQPEEATARGASTPEMDHSSIQVFLKISNCAVCGCTRTNTVLMPPHCKHYAALRCGECDCFRSWIPKPSTTQRCLEQQQASAQLLESLLLSDWERGFLESIKIQKKLSPRQQERLNRFAAKGGAA